MEIREATRADGTDIRAVADASLGASYADPLGEDIVDEAADEWYAEDRLADRLDADDVQYLVAETDGGNVVGFSESELDGDAAAAIQWLHVHPDARGEGVGVQLLEHTETELLERGANRVEGRVLAANEPGNEFYRDHGYARTGDRGLDVGDETHTEHLYVKLPEGEEDVELAEQRETDAGTLWVAFDERERGSAAPFYTAYRDEQRTEKYGFYCANCETADTAMNTMGRVACNNCGNERRETRWDAAYL
jgi:ribosomal protein S18 acetylase RimI-like enzyme